MSIQSRPVQHRVGRGPAIAHGGGARSVLKLAAVFRITLLGNLAYAKDIALRSLMMAMIMFVFVQLWTFTFATTGEAVIEGFSLRDLVWYLVLTETVVLSAPRVSQKIDEEVRSGAIAYVLLRPYDYLLYHLASYWGEGALRLPVNLAVGSLVAVLAVGPPATSAIAVVAAAMAIVLGLTINFVVEALFGLSAFWFEDSQPFFWIYQKLVFSLGGLFLPLEFFPSLLKSLASVLPFATVTYTPGRLFVAFEWPELALRLALQLGWLALLALACAAVFRRAIRKVNVNGG